MRLKIIVNFDRTYKLLARVLNACFSFLNKTMNLQKLLLTRRFFSTLAFFSMQTVFFIYLQGKGLSNSEIAFSLSLLFFCNQALAILAGIWGDHFGLAKMMLLGCFLDVYLVPMRKPAYWYSRVKNTKRKPDCRENI